MNSKRFGDILDESFVKIESILAGKAGQYATDDDRLSNFRRQAMLNDETVSAALQGNMSKHTVSLYNMLNIAKRNPDKTLAELFPLDVWDEKVFDHLNYLILLRAVILDQIDKDVEF